MSLPSRGFELTANRPLRLDDPGELLIVESGRADVFAVPARGGEPAGARRLLFTLESGGACLGASADGHFLLAVGSAGTRARRGTLASLEEALSGGRLSPEAEEARQLAEAYARRVAAAISEPRDKLFDSHWDAARPLRSAEGFRERLHSWVAERLARESASESERLRRKSERDAALYAGGLRRLAGVIEAPEDEARRGGGGDELLAAMRLVGAALDAAIEPADEDARGLGARHRLEAIARASRVRVRRVALRGARWWEKDSGPLLAFVASAEGAEADGRPVALLPARRGLILAEPGGERRLVDAALAGALEPFAWQLYRPFPDRPLGLLDVLVFGGKERRVDLAWAVGTAMAGAALASVPAFATGALFETVIPNAQLGALGALAAALAGAAAGSAAFGVTQAIATLRVEGRWDAAVQAALWDRLLRLPAPFFRRYAVGDLAARAMAINQIRRAFGGASAASLLALLNGATNLVLLFHFSPDLALPALGIAAATLLFYAAALWASLRLRPRMMELEGRLSGLVFQLLGGISKLRVAAAERRAFAVWSGLYAESARLSYLAELSEVWTKVFNAALPVLSSLALYWLAAEPVAKGSLTLGSFTAFTAAFTVFVSSATSLSATVFSLLDVRSVWARAKPLLEAMPEVDGRRAAPGRLRGRIDVSRVSFRYRPDGPKILDDVSFTVEPGQFVALVGPSGSGKSTVLRLLLGFETPETGAVYYDGKDLSKLDVAAVRRQIGVVLQHGRLMAGDILSNIVGSLPLGIDDAWAAAEAAGVAEDIREMPMGMQTVIAEGGSTLSGGQRQRLIIARALVRRPANIFLDEATSALDNRTQAVVAESLDKMKATRVVIAHRLSTIRHADLIVVMKDGRVSQTGTYDDLVSRPGLFQDLATRQLA